MTKMRRSYIDFELFQNFNSLKKYMILYSQTNKKVYCYKSISC